MGCLKSKSSKQESSMLIQGSHDEHHLALKSNEKPSNVTVEAGIHQLKQQYIIDKKCLGKGAFGKVYRG